MASVNLGRIKLVWKGNYSALTAYAVDDIVYYTTDGTAYICKLATTGNAPTNTTYWDKMAQGANIGSLSGLAQGDILYYNGTTWTRLGAGTSGQVLSTGGAAANPAWADSKFVNASTYVSTTRMAPPPSCPDVNSRATLWSFSVTKQKATSNLYMNGYLAGRQGNNGFAVFWWRINGGTWYRCGFHNYIATYGMGDPLTGYISSSDAGAGTFTVDIGYSSNTGYPWSVWNPNSSDHSEIQLGSESRVNIYEVLP